MKLPDKKYIGAFCVGILWGLIIAFVFCVVFFRSYLVREYESTMNFDDTVNTVTAKAQGIKGWIVKSGSCSLPKPADGTRMWTITLCNAAYASAMLNDENSRKISSVIPCTFAIYEKKDGKTYISRMNVKLLGYLLGGQPGKVFPQDVAPDQTMMLDKVVK
ncbi:MAG TPA: hypothetical protein DCZ94_07060 [Lentisphaeria bacterium]|nr:MAG: hypothetical protein A2X48_10325 [Lentisphaerae bacterium GWF2_49_21]HBC86694.1 hypothetical protein [Lentisphaeria bacterium]